MADYYAIRKVTQRGIGNSTEEHGHFTNYGGAPNELATIAETMDAEIVEIHGTHFIFDGDTSFGIVSYPER